MKSALITGITGQDGYYLAQLLLEKGYQVHGLARWHSSGNGPGSEEPLLALAGAKEALHLHFGDLTDATMLGRLLHEVQPVELYNLAAITPVPLSFDNPDIVASVNAVGPLRLLESMRLFGGKQRIRFFQASTSELFGRVRETPQTELTPFVPRSPYAIAKAYAYWITVNYREAYGLHASNGLMFNHESPRRGEAFVTRKITLAAAKIRAGQQSTVSLGNLDAERDWGHARDYMRAAWLMLQQDTADDYVIASGETHSVREFVETAFSHAGIQLAWEGAGVSECGRDVKTGSTVVDVDPRFFRPIEDDTRCGDASKAEAILGWRPSTSFDELVGEMVRADLSRCGLEALKPEER